MAEHSRTRKVETRLGKQRLERHGGRWHPKIKATVTEEGRKTKKKKRLESVFLSGQFHIQARQKPETGSNDLT